MYPILLSILQYTNCRNTVANINVVQGMNTNALIAKLNWKQWILSNDNGMD